MIAASLERRLKRLAINNCYRVISSKIHFSFIVERNRIISWGYNQIRKSHPIAAQFGHRFNDVHAELSAIAAFPYKINELKYFTLYNLRIRRDNGQLAMSKPCVYCINMLNAFDMSDIYYTNYSGGWTQYEV